MKEPLISVIVPVYNVKLYLEQCFDSILGNIGIQKCEVIVVDDGSTDGSEVICDNYMKLYPDIFIVYHNKNHGLLYSRQFGVKKSTGKYIMNCDSDDFISVGAIDAVINVITKHPNIEVILFNMNSCSEKNTKCLTKDLFPGIENGGVIDCESVHREFLSSTRIVSMCCKVYMRSIVIDKNYEDYYGIKNGEDTLQSVDIFCDAEKYYYINEQLYNYRTQIGMTSKFDKNYFRNFEHAIFLILQKEASWKVSNIDSLIAKKLFFSMGRAITQARYAKNSKLIELMEYFKLIRESKLVEKYMNYYEESIKGFSNKYKLLLSMLIRKKYILLSSIIKLRSLI